MVSIKLTEPQIRWLLNLLENEVRHEKNADINIKHRIIRKLKCLGIIIQSQRDHHV